MATTEEKLDEPVQRSAADFASQAEQPQPGVLAEFWDFFLHNKKWWITPIIAVLLLMGLLILLSGTSVAPFIYTIW
jgi:hypothetical protein